MYTRSIITFFTAFSLLIAGAWWWVLNRPIAFLDGEYPMWRMKLEAVEECRPGPLPILGDSRATAGLIPERMGPEVLNLAFGGMSPVEVYYYTKRLLECPDVPESVILSFAPFHFMEVDTLWERGVKFRALDAADLFEILQRSRALNDARVMLRPGLFDADIRLKSYLYAHGFPSYYYSAMLSGRLYGRKDKNHEIYEDITHSRGQHFFGTAAGSEQIDIEAGFETFNTSPLIDEYFDRTLKALDERGVHMYFISLPHNEASMEKMAQDLPAEFAQYLRQYTSRYTRFHLLGDTFPVLPNRYFGDGSHLNASGAIKWSDQTRRQLNAIPKLKKLLYSDKEIPSTP